MAVKIKLKRLGKIHAPQYRIVVADSRTARNGRAIEEIGIYQPMLDPSVIQVNSERVQYWLGVGALPTEAVAAILRVTGDWQKFKGLPGAEGTLRVAEPKQSKVLVFEAAVKAAGEEPKAAPKPKLAKAVEAVVVAEVAEAVAAEAVAEAVVAELIAEEVIADPTADDATVEEAVIEAAVAEAVAEEAVIEAVVAEAVAEEAVIEAVAEEAIEDAADEEAKA